MEVRALAEFDLVIVGGGVAGGALGAALAHGGGDTKVLLLEQSKRSGAINRGDFISPPHMELLERWGALQGMLEQGAELVRYDELYDNEGNLLLRHDFGYYRAAYDYGIALSHPEIEERLLQAASANPNLTIWRGARFEGLTHSEDGRVTLRVQREGHEVDVRTPWVVAADGRTSRLRQEAGIESAMHGYPYEILMARVPKPERWHQTAAQFFGPKGYAGLFVVNGKHYRLALPIPDGNFAAFMQKPVAERNAEVARRASLLADTEIYWDQVHSYRLYWHHAPTYVNGRVILMGDAAHSFTPFLGMGMNLALEDAAQLAPLLAHRSRLGSLDEATLKREYEARRRPRNQRVLAQSNRQGALMGEYGLTHKLFRASLWVASRVPAIRDAGFRATFA